MKTGRRSEADVMIWRLSGILVLMSEASHGVHGKAVGRQSEEVETAKRLAPFASPLGVLESCCRKHLTLSDDS